MADVDEGADKSDLPKSDLRKASWNPSATTAKNTTAPTITPTIAMMTAAMLVPFDFPDRHNPTMLRMNAAGSNTQPTMSAPGIQANTHPIMLRISATRPTACFASPAPVVGVVTAALGSPRSDSSMPPLFQPDG